MVWRAATALLAAFCLSACARSAAQRPYDLVITGGAVLNGDGTPAVRADVGIRAGRIAAIGDLAAAAATRRIDASGLAVSPASSTCTITRTTRSSWSRSRKA
jgi:urease alpha subunit